MDNRLAGRNTNFDILRIVAALMVLMVHVGYEFPWIQNRTFYGFYGTTLFFVLSGYLAMVSMEKCKSAIDFYKKRIVRIVPVYWAVLTIIYVVNAITALVDRDYAAFAPGGVCSFKFIRYYLFMQMFTPTDNFGLWNNRYALWSMSAFFLFYVVAPFLYKILRRFYIAFIVLIVMLFAYKPFVGLVEGWASGMYGDAAEPFTFATFFPLSVMYAFVAGITVYLAVKEKKQMVFMVCAVISLIYNGFQWFQWDITFMMFVLCAASVGNESATGVSDPVIRVSDPVKVVNGIEIFSKFSFSLYLTHPFVLAYVMKLQDVLVPYIRHKGFLGFVVIVCILTGYLFWRFVEEPLCKRAKRGLGV